MPRLFLFLEYSKKENTMEGEKDISEIIGGQRSKGSRYIGGIKQTIKSITLKSRGPKFNNQN